jgi:hypothetical protein
LDKHGYKIRSYNRSIQWKNHTKIQIDYKMVPEAEAIRGHRSPHSLATGPVTAEPFISPLMFTTTPALSREEVVVVVVEGA